jgi:pyruvate dehydrogenase phosphatase
MASVQANSRNEDRACVLSRNGLTIATVADGHGSDFVSQFVVDRLPEEIFTRMCLDSSKGSTVGIIAAFVHIDNLLRDVFVSNQETADWHAGSCAITAVVSEKTVTIANCGDSRGLLLNGSSYRWVSEPHTADSESEQNRLRSLHPDELDVVHCRQKIVELDGQGKVRSARWAACYVKGRLQPTRSFGDFYLKDHRATQFCPDLVPQNSSRFTPPYIEVAPSIEQFERKQGAVLVLASDGLWDYLSPEDVVEVLNGFPKGASAQSMASALIEKALAIAAEATNGELSLTELKALNPGREKRNIHDDITAVVVLL